MRLGHRVASGLFFVCLAACSGDDDEPDAGPCVPDPRVQVGRGGSRFRALGDGDDLPIVLGSQGGIHVLVGFRARDIDLNLVATYALRDAETGERVGTDTEARLRPTLFETTPDGSVRNPDLLVLDNEMPSVERFEGRVVDLSLVVESGDLTLCDVARVTLTRDDE